MNTEQLDESFINQTFLVIDDSSFVRRIVWNALKGFGVKKVIEAKDAVAGLEILRSSGGNINFILVDRDMPLMDGIEFIKLVRHDKDLSCADIPIIMISGASETDKIVEAKKAGIDGFLVKPFSPSDLKRHILAVLSEKNSK